MELHGNNIIAGELARGDGSAHRATDPTLVIEIDPPFTAASAAQIDQAVSAADEAFDQYRALSDAQVGDFLDRIGEEIIALGDALVERATQETALPTARITMERGRTVGQLKMFANLVRDGSYIDARIDTAIPDRQPLPKPDLRSVLMPIGPIVVFAASNFPLAFSVAGGDTASALAAGCPVVFKAHRAHPGTSELVATAIGRAVQACDMPAGVFSLIHGGHDVG
ncbi:MAG: aldehyde dehydrogenase family protein, partial [Phycisphaeraceae bacterium]|nr:aldehyde dehydrogenase family protein [Phycisphaeraceae bacterium]